MAPRRNVNLSEQPTNYLFIRPLMNRTVEEILIDSHLSEANVTQITYTRNRNGAFICLIDEFSAINVKKTLVESNQALIIDFTVPIITPIVCQLSSVIPSHASFLPRGLIYIRNFITTEEEQMIVSRLDTDNSWSDMLLRRVQHFGIEFDYFNKTVGKSAKEPFPEWASTLAHKIERLINDEHSLQSHESPCSNNQLISLEQLTCNEYLPGVGISSHCDTHSAFGDFIPVVSLLTPITFDMVAGPEVTSSERKVSLWIEPRSLLIMSGESRYGWKHSISKRIADIDPMNCKTLRSRRISLTFREVLRDKPCKCVYETLCDTRNPPELPRHIKNAE